MKAVLLLSRLLRLSTTLALVPETRRRCWPMHQGLCIFQGSELQACLGWAWGSYSTSKNQFPYFVLKFVWNSDSRQILWQLLNLWGFIVSLLHSGEGEEIVLGSLAGYTRWGLNSPPWARGEAQPQWPCKPLCVWEQNAVLFDPLWDSRDQAGCDYRIIKVGKNL